MTPVSLAACCVEDMEFYILSMIFEQSFINPFEPNQVGQLGQILKSGQTLILNFRTVSVFHPSLGLKYMSTSGSLSNVYNDGLQNKIQNQIIYNSIFTIHSYSLYNSTRNLSTYLNTMWKEGLHKLNWHQIFWTPCFFWMEFITPLWFGYVIFSLFSRSHSRRDMVEGRVTFAF